MKCVIYPSFALLGEDTFHLMHAPNIILLWLMLIYHWCLIEDLKHSICLLTESWFSVDRKLWWNVDVLTSCLGSINFWETQSLFFVDVEQKMTFGRWSVGKVLLKCWFLLIFCWFFVGVPNSIGAPHTGWPFRLCQTSCWHQNKSSVLIWGACTKT